MIPHFNPSNSVLTTVDDDGTHHHHHLDQQEGEQFFSVLECLATGRNELGMLLGNSPNPEQRTAEDLKRCWLNKVVGAGLSPEQAISFLATRLQQEVQP